MFTWERFPKQWRAVTLLYSLLTQIPGNEVKKIFSPRERASTWRKLWLWLAEAEKEVGLTQITDKAIEALRANLIVSDEAFQVIAAEERIRRHDVMSAIFALEKDAPDAAGIIHIGATSCYGKFVYRRLFPWLGDV